jgi:hypothetical protein
LKELIGDTTTRTFAHPGGPFVRRRDVVPGVTAVGALLAAEPVRCSTPTAGWAPCALTPQVFIDGFATVFGRQPEFRKNHAKDIAVAGHFDSNGNGATCPRSGYSTGANPGRFSLAGGNAHMADAPAAVRGLGLAFGFPGRQQWRTAMLNLPVFVDNSRQDCYDRLIASAVVPETGKPDPAAMSRLSRRPSGNQARHEHRRAASGHTGFRRQPLTSVRDGMLSRMTFALSRARRLGRPLRVVRGQ